MWTASTRWLLAAALVASATVVGAEERDWLLGARWGASNTDGFHRWELFGGSELPYSWQWQGGDLDSSLLLSLGELESHGDTGRFISLGPSFSFQPRPGSALSFTAGVAPTLLLDHEYPTLDLGGPLMFTTHLGLEYRLSPRLELGYRLQHMSNAYLYFNPGIDLHTLELGWQF